MGSIHKINKNIPILVVDDQLAARKNVRKALTQLGFKSIEEADDGDTALERLKSGSFRLVVSDSAMERVSGIQLLKEMRSDEALNGVPFVMIASEANKESVLEAIKAGVSNYMTKPVTVEDLRGSLEEIAGKL